MLFYCVDFCYDLLPLGSESPLAIKNNDFEREEKWKRILRDMNNNFESICKNLNDYIIIATRGEWGKLSFSVACKAEKKYFASVKKQIISMLAEKYKVDNVKMTEKFETAVRLFEVAIKMAANADIIDGSARMRLENYKIDYFDNRRFDVREALPTEKKITLKKAIRNAEGIMAPASFLEELQRIYSPDNEKNFYGHPVHYKITAGSQSAAMDLVMQLIPALHTNHRLPGIRVSNIYNIDDTCYDEIDMENLFERAKGSTVVIELNGNVEEDTNYASEYENVIDYMSNLIIEHQNEVLCIFVENAESPGFSAKMMSKVKEELDIIDLTEGGGDRKHSLDYLNQLADKSAYAKVKDRRFEEYLPMEVEYFSVSELRKIFKTWSRNSLKQSIYRSYNLKTEIKVKKEEGKKKDAYDKLQAMIGLKDVKEVVEQMITFYKMQKLKQEMGLKQEKISCHMIFTGNPGSAKTTVARLIASILKTEGILSTGKLVECGRGDLVGKYVGWTAKQVKSKFREARGGVLFIDEAYALVDDANSFGDEAINTIVQEMENNRDDVIVIFAGYPDKMKKFLDKNEGLRSRIAFHIDFPDYNAEELTEILKLMAAEKGYHIDTAIEKKCMDIFKNACGQPEFGNGRYARNLLEQAIMKQSMRVLRENKGKQLNKQTLLTMDVSDFEVNTALKKEKKPVIGFVI